MEVTRRRTDEVCDERRRCASHRFDCIVCYSLMKNEMRILDATHKVYHAKSDSIHSTKMSGTATESGKEWKHKKTRFLSVSYQFNGNLDMKVEANVLVASYPGILHIFFFILDILLGFVAERYINH